MPSNLWIEQFRRAYPGADVIGKLGALLVVRFADGMICKVVGGDASAPTVMQLQGAELQAFQRSVRRREAGALGTEGATPELTGSDMAKRAALMVGGAAMWAGAAAGGAALYKRHPAAGAAIATALLSAVGLGLAASIPFPGTEKSGEKFSDPESEAAAEEIRKAIRKKLMLVALGTGTGATGAGAAGAALAKRHPAAGAGVGAALGAFAGSLGTYYAVK